MNFLFETRGSYLKDCKVQNYRRSWNGKIRSYVLSLSKNGCICLPAKRSIKLPMNTTLSIEVKKLSEFDHILICLDFLDRKNHPRVLQLSTALRSKARSPHMIRDVAKLGNKQWTLLTIHLRDLIGLFSQPLEFATRLRIFGRCQIRNVFIGSGSSLVTEAEVNYPKQDSFIDLEKVRKTTTPLENLIGSMELCKVSYSQALDRIDDVKEDNFNIYSGKINHPLYKPLVENCEVVAQKAPRRKSTYHLLPISTEWRKSSVNSSIDVLTEVGDRDEEL